MITNAIFILVLPLIAFAVQIFIGKRLPKQGAWLPTGTMFICLLLALPIFFDAVKHHEPDYIVAQQTWDWINFGSVKVSFGIFVDNLTAIMLMIVTLISSLVHLYSIGYMNGDKLYSRYFAYLSLFSFSMLGLVLADSFFAIYCFWELVGLSSYLLIGFWFEKKSAADAGKKAFITNRVGDVGMFAAIMIIFSQLGTLNFQEVFSKVAAGEMSGTLLTVAGVLLFFGAIGKSAQFPLHVWLPDAMEGPTPVSALIHAATMVAAGVYLVGRTFTFFTAEALIFIAYIGTITAFIGATIAIVQTDIKRVLAYSTISQLGFMMVGLGTGSYTAGLFHLTTHAFFKACLFLGSGSVIHAVHSQEMPEMGGLRKKMPITFWTFLIATLSLSGFPFLFTGFHSKDMILASALELGLLNSSHLGIFVVVLLSAGLTGFYMFRLIFLTFFGEARDTHKFEHAHESPWTMTVPLITLAVLSLGYWPGFTTLLERPVHAVMSHAHGVPEEVAHSAHSLAMIASIIVALSGIGLAYLVYHAKKISAENWGRRLRPVYTLLWNKYYFDELYNATVVGGTLLFSRVSSLFDLRVIDGVVNGVARITAGFSFGNGKFDLRVIDGLLNLFARAFARGGGVLRRLQTGQVQSYILMALFAVILLFLIQQF